MSLQDLLCEIVEESINEYITILSIEYKIEISELKQLWNGLDDKYDKFTLIDRYNNFKSCYLRDESIINKGIPIRHQNPPEDITENITKFIIRKVEKDNTCVWCKGLNDKMSGDLYSKKLGIIEVKSFTSNGPSQFGPNSKFNVLYFLDLRNWLKDEIVLWKVNLNNESPEFKNIKVNKTQTLGEQLKQGRRPHIGWDKIYPQIYGFYEQMYKGSFEDIF